MERPQFDKNVYGAETQTLAERVLTTISIVTAVVIVLALLWFGSEVFMLVFAGLLLAVLLLAIADWIAEHTGLSRTWSVAVTLLLIISLITLAVWLLAPSVKYQFWLLWETLPRAFEQFTTDIGQAEAGRQILDNLPRFMMSGSRSAGLLTRMSGVASTTLDIVINVLVILAVGIYFAFDPTLYYAGVTKLFPKSRQLRIREVLNTLNFTLSRWLIGRLTVMAINGALTAAVLWFLGVPLALPLGILTGVLNFIPNIGPLLAAVPAVLIAFTQSPTQALYVAILYLVIQNLDGFVITPIIQQKSVSLPPVLIISSQLLLAILFGFLGLLLAVPLVAVIFVLVRMLYVEDILDNRTDVKGESAAKDEVKAES